MARIFGDSQPKELEKFIFPEAVSLAVEKVTA